MSALRKIVYFVAALSLYGCFTVKNTDQFSYTKLTPAAYASALSTDSNYYLIDVRTAKEYQKAHIFGATNFDFLKFHFAEDVDSLDRNRTAYLYCHTCHRSPFAAKEMKKAGFHVVYDLAGGFSKWMKAGNKTETLGK